MVPDRQPVLEGGRVRLRPIRADDWDALYAAGSDPLIWEQHPARNRWKEPHFRDYFDGALASGGALVVIDKPTGALIGSSRYEGYDPEQDEIEIGYTFLIRAHWGGGTNGEMKRLMVDHIHRFVRTAYFRIAETNTRSRRAMEKIGGVLRPGTVEVRAGDVVIPHVVYDLRRPA